MDTYTLIIQKQRSSIKIVYLAKICVRGTLVSSEFTYATLYSRLFPAHSFLAFAFPLANVILNFSLFVETIYLIMFYSVTGGYRPAT